MKRSHWSHWPITQLIINHKNNNKIIIIINIIALRDFSRGWERPMNTLPSSKHAHQPSLKFHTRKECQFQTNRFIYWIECVVDSRQLHDEFGHRFTKQLAIVFVAQQCNPPLAIDRWQHTRSIHVARSGDQFIIVVYFYELLHSIRI